jgi:AraC-like DNA-binding protein
VSNHIPTDKETIEQVKAIMLGDLSRGYSLAELAALSGTTPYTLKRIFKKQTSESLDIFYRRARIEKAKELLRTTNNTIQMIAEAVGYTEGNNFQNSFKRMMGCTPGEWRRMHDTGL